MKKIHGNVVSATRENKEKYLSEVLASEDDIGIEYMGGEMVHTPGKSGLYMLAPIGMSDEYPFDEVELYAEVYHDDDEYDHDEYGEILNPEKYDDEDYKYLKGEIIAQAKDRGIDLKRLVFFYDCFDV